MSRELDFESIIDEFARIKANFFFPQIPIWLSIALDWGLDEEPGENGGGNKRKGEGLEELEGWVIILTKPLEVNKERKYNLSGVSRKVPVVRRWLCWLILCVSLTRLWCPVVWSNTSLEVATKVLVDVMTSCSQLD